MNTCTAIDCELPTLAKKLCSKHYYRQKRGTTPVNGPSRFTKRPAIIVGEVAKLPLGIEAKLGYAIVDKDFAHLDRYNWSIGGRGYAMAYIDKKVKKLHHLVMGKPPEGFELDHLNRNKLDNRIANLRLVTHRENMENVDPEMFKNLRYRKGQ